MQEPLLTFSSLPGVQVLSCFISSSFSFLFFFCPMWLYRDLSCAFGYLRSSASSQQVVCENYSICRCLLGAFMWRDALLSSRPTPSPPWTVCYMQGIVRDTWDPTVIQADNDAHPCGPWVKVWGEVGDLH